nr:hypothetical protein [Tanacetum cinerariifolium]
MANFPVGYKEAELKALHGFNANSVGVKRMGERHLRSIWRKSTGSILEKLDKNTTFQDSGFHSDAFTKSSQKAKFLIKVLTSQVVETTLDFTPDAVRIEEQRRHRCRQREAHAAG